MLPPPPGLFSTTAVWLRLACKPVAISRATTSLEPPGVNGTMMRIVLLGKPAAGADGCWARAASGQATEQKAEDPAAAPASSVMNSRRFIRSPRGKGKGHARDLRRPADWQDWQSLQVRRTAAVSQRSAPGGARLPYSRKKSSTAVSASTASGMLWRWERARSSAVCVACR